MSVGPIGFPLVDMQTGMITPQWQAYFSSLSSTTTGGTVIKNIIYNALNIGHNIGTTTTTLASINIPAAYVTSNCKIEVLAWGFFAVNSNTRDILIDFGGTQVASFSITSPPSTNFLLRVAITVLPTGFFSAAGNLNMATSTPAIASAISTSHSSVQIKLGISQPLVISAKGGATSDVSITNLIVTT